MKLPLPTALAAICTLLSPTLAQPTSPPTRRDQIAFLRCGQVMIVAGRQTLPDTTIMVRNGVIERLMPGVRQDEAAKTEEAAGNTVARYDLSDSWVMPGLIDCHVHLTNEWDQGYRLRIVQETEGDSTIRTILNAKKTLEAGFTTVRDLGARTDVIFSVRNAIDRGDIQGPRILAAGCAISITGGHGDPTLGYRPDLMGTPTAENGVADGPAECAKAVRAQIKKGADVIKVMSTGGVLSASGSGVGQHYSDQELAAVIATAHAMGRKTAAHAHGTDGINAALRAGIDSIEHGTYLDDESIKLFKEHGAWYVPTLLAGRTTAENAKVPGYYLPMVAKKAEQVGPKLVEAFRKAHAAGVKIAFGTDSGVSPHGQNARELGLMVEAGMTPAEALEAATVKAADLLGLTAQIGTLEKGKAADIIAVRADPTKDIREMERVTFVMKGGAVVKNTAR